MTRKGPTTPPPEKFEDAYTRLQAIVEKLESGDASLEESLELYTEGMSLVRLCGEKLNAAQKRIEQLNVPAQDEPEEG